MESDVQGGTYGRGSRGNVSNSANDGGGGADDVRDWGCTLSAEATTNSKRNMGNEDPGRQGVKGARRVGEEKNAQGFGKYTW